MICVGINGFGRIGKCVFLQLINNTHFQICALNAIGMCASDIEDYLKYDSTHSYPTDFIVEIISDKEIKINHHQIKLLSDRNAKNLHWNGSEYIIDATGHYLTTAKCSDYNVDYVIMSAPAKDDSPTFIFGANHEKYNGEKIVSASSCTTNCLAPMLKLLHDNYKIVDCNFTTIHATTASQYTVDILNKSARTNRSIFNNIIPHTTGASASILSVLPELKGKIAGTSIRVPVNNCSLLDVNVELENKTVTLSDIEKLIKSHELFNIVYQTNKKNLVSCDFITTDTPTILDIKASIDIGNGKFKLMIWYDNEWSYSAQMIRMVKTMSDYNILNKSSMNSKYYFENIDMFNKNVVLRVDYNVPCINGEITDDFRIASSIPTIKTILSKQPKSIILASHFGRPSQKDSENSLRFIIPVLQKYLDFGASRSASEGERLNSVTSVKELSLSSSIQFLEDGISEKTREQIQNQTEPTIVYLLENLRFHKEETEYDETNINNVVEIYRQLGDVFISDAFGCVHRKHMSICDMKHSGKLFGYGHLIKKEVDAFEILVNNSTKKILGIIGGNKIADKMPLIDSIRTMKNANLFITGGIAKHYKENHDNVTVMSDGYGNVSLQMEPEYITNLHDDKNCYDIGNNSLYKLMELVDKSDVVFWNGSLGVIEHEIYKKGSLKLVNYLENAKDKTVIIGGGETASLFSNSFGLLRNPTEFNRSPSDCSAILQRAPNSYDNASHVSGVQSLTYDVATQHIRFPPNDCEHIYVSTGGGALLEYLQQKTIYGKMIPGLQIFCA